MTPSLGVGPRHELIREAAWIARCVGRAETAPLRESDLVALASYIQKRELKRGEALFLAGGDATGVWVIRAGAVELSVGVSRARVVIHVLWPGDVDGDIALLQNMASPYTARALEDTLCLVFEPGPFERLLLENGPVARRWLSSCVARLAKSHARVVQLLGRSLPQQLARLLLDEAVDDKIRLPQRTLAAMLGVQRPPLNKALKQLERDGVVQVGYREVTIVERDGLERIAAP